MSAEPDVDQALDAYSRIVTAVPADLTPHVAALQVTGRDGRGGAGSAVVVSADGLLLTNAHVVAAATPGRAGFAAGARPTWTSSAPIRCPTWPSSGRAAQPLRPPSSAARRT